jgi:hypothetical protein
MSQELTPFEQQAKAKAMAPTERNTSSLTNALAGGSAGSAKRISFKGSRFRMIINNEQAAVRPENELDVVFVASAPGYCRTFYKGAYDPDATESRPPVCWSEDDKHPSEHAPEPQADACANCQQNIKGSASDGKGRACRYSARVAVVLDGDFSGDVYGMTIPSMSIWGDASGPNRPLQAYARYLDANHADVATVVTRLTFDDDAPVPRPLFRAVRQLNDEEAATCAEQALNPEVDLHTGPRKYSRAADGGEVEEDGDKTPFEQEAQQVAPKKKVAAKKKAAAKKKVAAKKKPEPEPEVEDEGGAAEEADDDISNILAEWGED